MVHGGQSVGGNLELDVLPRGICGQKWVGNNDEESSASDGLFSSDVHRAIF